MKTEKFLMWSGSLRERLAAIAEEADEFVDSNATSETARAVEDVAGAVSAGWRLLQLAEERARPLEFIP